MRPSETLNTIKKVQKRSKSGLLSRIQFGEGFGVRPQQNWMNKILFISHDAARTGAPILLIQILKWLRKESGSLIQIVLINGGELEPDFKALGKVIVINRPNNLFYRLVERVSRRVLIKILDLEN